MKTKDTPDYILRENDIYIFVRKDRCQPSTLGFRVATNMYIDPPAAM